MADALKVNAFNFLSSFSFNSPFLLLLLLHMGELNHFPYTVTAAAAAAVPVTKTGTINNKQRHDARVP